MRSPLRTSFRSWTAATILASTAGLKTVGRSSLSSRDAIENRKIWMFSGEGSLTISPGRQLKEVAG